jgi:phosphopantothenoylcysteine synthetase/decarboxylase
MRVLVTTGNTQVLIDRVRCITNIFTGKTGTGIALAAHQRGHAVTLLTSHPEVIDILRGSAPLEAAKWAVLPYRTFDELENLMAQTIANGGMDAVIHCAAVSDFRADGVFAVADGTAFDSQTRSWNAGPGHSPTLVDRRAGKIKSDEPEIWLRLQRTPKLIDRIRPDWKFKGILVKFKLEVGLSDAELTDLAERSRRQSDADLMVANSLEGAASWALVGPVGGQYQKVPRAQLSGTLLMEVERMYKEQHRG